MTTIDSIDARILEALTQNARLSGVEIAQRLGLARNTVQAHLARLESGGVLAPVDRRVLFRPLGYPLTAFITAELDQHRLNDIQEALTAIPEVVEVHGIAGAADLLIRVVARDADDLYRIAGLLLDAPGVLRTSVSLSMREMVPYRSAPLLERTAAGGPGR